MQGLDQGFLKDNVNYRKARGRSHPAATPRSIKEFGLVCQFNRPGGSRKADGLNRHNLEYCTKVILQINIRSQESWCRALSKSSVFSQDSIQSWHAKSEV